MTQKELEKMLRIQGWKPRRGHGSHLVYKHGKATYLIAIKRRGGNYRIPDAVWADIRKKMVVVA